MKLRKARLSDFNRLYDLFKENYESERASVYALPEFDEIKNRVKEILNTLFEHYDGLVALNEGLVVGYLFYVQSGELFGKSEGAFVPLMGHASTKENKRAIYQDLLNEAGTRWVSNKKLSWVVTLFEHDLVLEKLFFDNGFGKRCVDAIAIPETGNVALNDIKILKATEETLKAIKTIHQKHTGFYQLSPLFMPGDEQDEFEALKASFAEPSTHIWIAYKNEEVVGYIRLSKNGESFISKHPTITNVTSAYVSPFLRGNHIATKLLETVKRYVIHETDYMRLGVDYESINPSGARFWGKHFIPYTKTVARRIDERILD